MRTMFNIIFLLTIMPNQVRAGGLPVVDTNELMKEVSDALYLFSSIETLLSEVGGTSIDKGAIASLGGELVRYQKAIRDYEDLQGAMDDASYYDEGRSKVFSDQINSISRHIRKLKTIVKLAKTMGARPEALNSSLQVIRDERARERERYEVALKALDEKEKIRRLRDNLAKRTRLSRSLFSEVEDINRFSQGKSVKLINFASNKKIKGSGSLW